MKNLIAMLVSICGGIGVSHGEFTVEKIADLPGDAFWSNYGSKIICLQYYRQFGLSMRWHEVNLKGKVITTSGMTFGEDKEITSPLITSNLQCAGDGLFIGIDRYNTGTGICRLKAPLNESVMAGKKRYSFQHYFDGTTHAKSKILGHDPIRAISPRGTYLACANSIRRIPPNGQPWPGEFFIVQELPLVSKLRVEGTPTRIGRTAHFSRNEKLLALPLQTGEVDVLSVSDGHRVARLPSPITSSEIEVGSVAFAANDLLVASYWIKLQKDNSSSIREEIKGLMGSADRVPVINGNIGLIATYDLRKSELKSSFFIKEWLVGNLSVSHDGRFCVVREKRYDGGNGWGDLKVWQIFKGSAIVYDLEKGLEVESLEVSGNITAVPEFSPISDHILFHNKLFKYKTTGIDPNLLSD